MYAYADYPDIPDLGRCYNIPLLSETYQDGYKVLFYIYSDMVNDDHYSYLYDNSAFVLGRYAEESLGYTDGVLTIAYTKTNEATPSYFIGVSYEEDGSMIFVVMIPEEATAENKVTLYALDGRTIEVFESEVSAYKNVGWYDNQHEAQTTNKTSNNLTAGGYYYRTPSGKKYHLDPDCGGKNSYRTTNISGLSPCSKCAK